MKHIAWYTSIAILVLAGCFVHVYRPIEVPIAYDIELLPLSFKDWNAQMISGGKDEELVKLPDPDKVIRLSYSSISGENHHLVIGHYSYQKQGKEYIHYTLDNIYDGAKEHNIRVAKNRKIDMKRVEIKEKGKKYLVSYWYDVGGYKTNNNIMAKLITAVRGVFIFKTDGSIVLIITHLEEKEKDAQPNHTQDAFIAALYPYLAMYLKEEY